MEMFKKQEEGEHQLSYLCNICSKIFVTGTALGGHMRVHAPASMDAGKLTETEFKRTKRPRDKSLEKDDEEGLDGNGKNLIYALRRNPKRSWRFGDGDDSFLLNHEFDSKSIGSSINYDPSMKESRSWKGVFGHMKWHSGIHQDSGDAHLEESQKHETRDKENDISEIDSEVEIDHPSGNSSRFDKWMKGERFQRSRYAPQLNPLEQFGSSAKNQSDAEIVIDQPSGNSSKFDKWVKGKRSKRSCYAPKLNRPLERFGSFANNEKKSMAMCPVMVACGVNTTQIPQFQMGSEKSKSGDLKLPNAGSQLPKCIRKRPKYKRIDAYDGLYNDDQAKKTRFKCATCNKVFHCHQGLGGHRASHNKVMECFSQIEEEKESQEEEMSDEEVHTGSYSQLPCNFHKPPAKERTKDYCVKARDETKTMETTAFSVKKSRVHECSICHRVFGSGQALGGHKRCHWVSAEASDTASTISSNKDTAMQQQMPSRVSMLDLNLPAPVDTGASDTITSCSKKETHMQQQQIPARVQVLGLNLPASVEPLDLNLPSTVEDDFDAENHNNLSCGLLCSHGASHAQTHSTSYS